MSIVARLKDACKAKGVSFNQFEIESGVGRGTAGKWDTNSPSVDKIIKAANYFGLSLEYLLTGSEAKKEPAPTGGSGPTDKQKAIIDVIMKTPPEELGRLERIINAALEK